VGLNTIGPSLCLSLSAYADCPVERGGQFTPFLAAVVKGTTFTVTVTMTEQEASVSVESGLVQVSSFTGGESADVGPGQQATVDQNQTMSVAGVDAAPSVTSVEPTRANVPAVNQVAPLGAGLGLSAFGDQSAQSDGSSSGGVDGESSGGESSLPDSLGRDQGVGGPGGNGGSNSSEGPGNSGNAGNGNGNGGPGGNGNGNPGGNGAGEQGQGNSGSNPGNSDNTGGLWQRQRPWARARARPWARVGRWR
jgi:hypothetical protein